jgi:hypothetical protein
MDLPYRMTDRELWVVLVHDLLGSEIYTAHSYRRSHCVFVLLHVCLVAYLDTAFD